MAAFPLSSVTEDVSSSKGASHGRSMFPSGAADAQYSNLYRSLDYPADSSARRTLSAGGGGAQLGRGRGGSGWLPSWLRPSFGAAESRDIESSGREASLRDARADDIDDEEEEELFCGCFEPLSPSERILGWLTCFLGNLVLSAVSLGEALSLKRCRRRCCLLFVCLFEEGVRISCVAPLVKCVMSLRILQRHALGAE